MKRKFRYLAAVFFLSVFSSPLFTQTAYTPQPAWLKPGFFVGGLAQYRLHAKEYSTGYDGDAYTIVKSGARMDLPSLTSMTGFGAVVGYVFCEGPRELAILNSIRWSYAKGQGDSLIGSLDFSTNQIGFVCELLIPFGSSGWAFTCQLGWDTQFFSVAGGYLPSGGTRTDLLISSFLGFDAGVGIAYVFDRRFLFEGRAVIRGYNDNMASGGGTNDSLGSELGRGEYSFELTAGILL